MAGDRRGSKYTPAANGSKWIRRSTRWAIYARDSFRCAYCAKVGGKLSLDHVKPCGRGVCSDPANLVTCCCSCNSAKQGKTKRAWFAKLRARGIDTEAVRRELARRVKLPIDRAVGRFLAKNLAVGASDDGYRVEV